MHSQFDTSPAACDLPEIVGARLTGKVGTNPDLLNRRALSESRSIFVFNSYNDLIELDDAENVIPSKQAM